VETSAQVRYCCFHACSRENGLGYTKSNWVAAGSKIGHKYACNRLGGIGGRATFSAYFGAWFPSHSLQTLTCLGVYAVPGTSAIFYSVPWDGCHCVRRAWREGRHKKKARRRTAAVAGYAWRNHRPRLGFRQPKQHNMLPGRLVKHIILHEIVARTKRLPLPRRKRGRGGFSLSTPRRLGSTPAKTIVFVQTSTVNAQHVRPAHTAAAARHSSKIRSYNTNPANEHPKQSPRPTPPPRRS